MRFLAVECDFGRLSGRYEFAPRITAVTGPNEAGKSTLHELLFRILYGFDRSERRQRRDGLPSPWEARRPWGGGRAYRAVATIIDRNGRELRIEWDFGDHQVRVLDARTGRDLSVRFRGKGRDVVLGYFLLGLGREEFRQICCLAQGDVDQPAADKVRQLAERLRSLVETGGEAGGVEEAIKRLEQAARERLGIDRRNWGPVAGGHWQELCKRKEQLRDQLDCSERERKAIGDRACEFAELHQQRERIAKREKEEHQRHLELRLRICSVRLERARELEEKAGTRPERPVLLPSKLPEQIAGLAADLRNAEREHREAAQRAKGERVRAECLRAELQQYEHELASLTPAGMPDAAGQEQIRILAAKVETWRAELAEMASADDLRSRVESLRATRDRLREVERSAQRTSRRWLVAALGVAAAGIALATAVDVGAAIAAFVLASALVAIGLARGAQARRALARTLSEAGVENSTALEDKLVHAQAELAAREQREHLFATDECKLVRCLDAHGAPAADDPLTRAQAYARALELGEHTQRIRDELKRADAVVADASRKGDRLVQVRTSLAQKLAEVGIEHDDLCAGLRCFEQLREQAERDARDLERAERASEALREMTAGRPVAALERERDALAQELKECIAATGPCAPGSSGSGDADVKSENTLADLEEQVAEVGKRLERLKEERADLDRKCSGLEQEIKAREQHLPDPAELRAELAAIEDECRTIELRRDALRVAIEQLQAAAAEAHRAFAPRLNEALGRLLPRITGGRYQRALVAEDLSVTVEAPETATLTSAELLSRGTRDQIYLLERLAIARLLDEHAAAGTSPSANTLTRAPLLLDDPFDRFDALRLAAGLKQLVEEARERQIVLFAEERSHIEALSELDPHCRVIELPAPLP